MLLAMILLLTSCVSAGQENNLFCDKASAIYLDKQDKLTPATARQVLKHDETGHVLCGWSRV